MLPNDVKYFLSELGIGISHRMRYCNPELAVSILHPFTSSIFRRRSIRLNTNTQFASAVWQNMVKTHQPQLSNSNPVAAATQNPLANLTPHPSIPTCRPGTTRSNQKYREGGWDLKKARNYQASRGIEQDWNGVRYPNIRNSHEVVQPNFEM